MSRFALALLLAISLGSASYADGPTDFQSSASNRDQLVRQIRDTTDERTLRVLMISLGKSPGGLPLLLELYPQDSRFHQPMVDALAALSRNTTLLIRTVQERVDRLDPKLLKVVVDALYTRPNRSVAPFLENLTRRMVSVSPPDRDNRAIFNPPFDAIYTTEALANPNHIGGVAVIEKFAASPDRHFRRLAVDGFSSLLIEGELKHSARLQGLGRKGLRDRCLDIDETIADAALLRLGSAVSTGPFSVEDIHFLMRFAVRFESLKVASKATLITRDILRRATTPSVQKAIQAVLPALAGDPTILSAWQEFFALLRGQSISSSALMKALADSSLRSDVASKMIETLFRANIKHSESLVDALAVVASDRTLPADRRQEAITLILHPDSAHAARALRGLIIPTDAMIAERSITTLAVMTAPEVRTIFEDLVHHVDPEVRMVVAIRLPKVASLSPESRLDLLRAMLTDEDATVANQAAEGILRLTKDIRAIESDHLLYKRVVAQLLTSSDTRDVARPLIAQLTDSERNSTKMAFAAIVAEEVPTFSSRVAVMQEVAERDGEEEWFRLFVRRLLIAAQTKEWGLLPEMALYSLKTSRNDMLPILLSLARGTNGPERLRTGEWAARVEAIRSLPIGDDPETTGALVELLASDYATGGSLLEGKAVGGVVENGLYNRYLKSNMQESFYGYIKAHMPTSLTAVEEHRLLQVYRRAESVGIMFPNRFVPDVRDRLLSELERPISDNRSMALMIYPKTDYNGAFSEDSHMARALLERGYRVVYQEAGYVAEVKRLLVESTRDQKADIIVIGGHGSAHSLDLGAQKLTPAEMGTLFDEGSLGAFQKGGLLVFLSCSVGAGKEANSNLVNAARKHIPTTIVPEGRVFGPTEPANFQEWVFDENGRAIDVRYTNKVETYHARGALSDLPALAFYSNLR